VCIKQSARVAEFCDIFVAKPAWDVLQIYRILVATIIHGLGPIVSVLIFSHFDPNQTRAGQLNKASPHPSLFYKASS
jgi:hypothetical protein